MNYLGGHNPRLHTDEVLVALSVLSENDENCRKALEQLPKLRGCQAHCTVMLSDVDQKIFKKLGVDVEMNKWIQAETPPSLLFLSNFKIAPIRSQDQCCLRNHFFLLYHIS